MRFHVYLFRLITQLGYRLDYSSNNTEGWRKELHKNNSRSGFPDSGGLMSMSQSKAEAGSPSLIVRDSDVSTYIYIYIYMGFRTRQFSTRTSPLPNRHDQSTGNLVSDQPGLGSNRCPIRSVWRQRLFWTDDMCLRLDLPTSE